MKLTTLVSIVLCLHVSAKSVSQTVTFSGEGISLEKTFKALKSQTGYLVFYNRELLRNSAPVTISARDMPLLQFLDNVLENQSLEYIIRGKTIFIRSKAASARTLPSSLPENDLPDLFPITGRITDSSGNPLVGATIALKKGSGSTVSDSQGQFTLDAAPGAMLIISYVGFETAGYHVKAGSENIHITLKPVRKAEEEVVIVSTGYQRLPRERAAGSFGIVNQADLEKRNNFNILTYLEGQVPGLLTAANGQLTIRGQSTIYANKDPLIVLDGFPVEKSIDAINANDIESITVLKDASAASIWGVRAANGVIVIQTKRGQSSRKPLDISFSGAFSTTPVPDLSALPFAPASSFIELEKFRVDNGLVFFAGNKPRPMLSPVVDAYLNDPSGAAQVVDDLKGVNAYNEFQDLFMNPATRQQYAIALSGRGERSSYRASFSYDKLRTEFKNDHSDRFVADLFQTSAITEKLRTELGLNLSLNNKHNNGMSFNDLRKLFPYQRITDDNGSYINQPQTFYQADKEELVAAGFPYNWDYNLLQEFNNKNNSASETNINAIAGINYQLIKGVSLNMRYQYELGNSNTHDLYNEETYFVRNLINYSTFKDNNGVITTGLPYYGSILAESSGKYYSHTLRGQIRADRELGSSKHYLSAIAGTEIREVGSSGSNQTNYGYDPQSLQFARVSYTTPYTNVRGDKNQLLKNETVFADIKNRFVSLFGNAGYTYDGKYTFNGSARLDQTNLFGSSKKYRNVWLWSTGASWQLHKERFFTSTLFNSLIIRATYGINGNVDRSSSPFLIAQVGTTTSVNRPYAAIVNPQNPLLRWEKTNVTNFGVDFSMLNNRIKGSVEYYNRYSHDLLGNATVNGTYGFSSAFINYASLRNSGTDIRLSGRILQRAFEWTATINYSYNKNVVKEVDFPQKTAGAFLGGTPQVGKPLNYLYGYAWAGLSATGAPQVKDQNKEIVDYKTEITDPAALIYEGTSVPPHYGALINEFSFKRFSVLTNFTYKLGAKFRIPVIQYQSISDNSNNVFKDWDARWQKPGDEAFTNTPAAPASTSGLNVYDEYARNADINVATASLVRFRELLVNYAIPQRVLGKNSTTAITLGLQVRNLATYKFNKAGLDPEYLVDSRGAFALPPRAEYTFILKANF